MKSMILRKKWQDDITTVGSTGPITKMVTAWLWQKHNFVATIFHHCYVISHEIITDVYFLFTLLDFIACTI